MLNLNCVICAELFGQSDDVHITHCGHMFHITCLKQWMERSKSCPQCRNKCTDRNVFRVYFNLANLDVSHIDVGSLQEQLDNAMLQLKMKEKESNAAQDQIKNLKDVQKKCMKTIAGLEGKLQKNDFIILSYNEQLKLLKSEVKVAADLREEVKSLKRDIATMEGISTILTGSSADAEKLLKTESDPKKLAVWVSTLKRELRNSENKKTDLRNVLKVVQKDMRKEIEQKKNYEERISQLESENYQLNEKVKSLESGITSAKTQRSPTSTSALNNSRLSSIVHEDRRITISPTIKENIKKIEDSNSPYLNIKASSIGFVPLFKRQHDGNSEKGVTLKATNKIATLKVSPNKNAANKASEMNDKLSIFKRPRLGMLTASVSAGASNLATSSLNSNYVFNGFGGSDKIDPFSNKSDDSEDEQAEEARRARKVPIGNGGLKVPASLSLSNRMKTGSLRNFKLNK